jgi:hypothetical protein
MEEVPKVPDVTVGSFTGSFTSHQRLMQPMNMVSSTKQHQI